MSCTSPLSGYESRHLNPSGKKRISFNPAASIDGKVIPLPCGRCIGCKLAKSRDWAIRAMHEAQMHEQTCFITLTYDDLHLHPDQSLHKSDFQLFMKKLRNQYPEKKIRYLMCGEYGSENKRAHFHALIFGHDFQDRYQNITGDPLDSLRAIHRPIGVAYVSAELTELWGKGMTHVGELNQKTAAYTARYTTKKITGPLANKIDPETGLKPYERNHLHTGDIVEVLPEYLQCSLRPGLGSTFYDKYKKDMFPGDTIFLGWSWNAANTRQNPVFVKPPKYYEKLLERERPDMLEFIKENRLAYADTHPENFAEGRLLAREIINDQRFAQLKRNL